MKHAKYLFNTLFLLFLTLSCNSNKAEVQEEKSESIEQWITYDGKKEMPKIVLVSGDEEYRSEEALPQIAKILTEQHGFNCTVLFAQDPEKPGVVNPNNTHNIPGLEKLDSADMMIIFTRFRALPDDQMKHIDNFLTLGKPVIGMRTSTHAFMFSDKDNFESSYARYGNNYGEKDAWQDGFGRLVMGEKWISHHGNHGHQSTRGIIAENAIDNAILNGISNGALWVPTDVYGVRLPLPGDSQPLLLGQVMDREGTRDDNDIFYGMRSTDQKIPAIIERKNEKGDLTPLDQNSPMMPVAWTKTYQLPNGKAGNCFSTTMGASADLLNEEMRRLIVNAVYWGLKMDIPEKANVNLVGDYKPSQFAFKTDDYWLEKDLIIGKTLK